MLFLEVPAFDVLAGQTEPYIGFGEAFNESQGVEKLFVDAEQCARARILEVFGVEWDSAFDAAPKLDAIISRMWEEGWSADADEINLFAADFGCVLSIALCQMYGGKLVFRSPSDLSHTSLWWQQQGLEAFPFHKTYKRLFAREGESLSFFADRLKHSIEP